MIMERYWAMANHNTFLIKPIREFVKKNIFNLDLVIDPFARGSKLASITNDLNPNFNTDYNLEALDFLKMFEDNSIDCVLFDPPYSLRQVKECYNSIGIDNMTQHQSKHFYSDLKNEISRIIKPKGLVLSFGWNTVGMGKVRGFKLEEIVLVCHGGNHNDTICLKERKEV